MIRALMGFLLVALPAPALAQPRDFRIGGEAYAESDIVDSRALPSLGGSPTIMLTLSDAAAKRLAAATARLIGKPLSIVLDGKTLMEPIVREPIPAGELQISGLTLNIGQASALAKRISGKDPLPESLDDEP